MTIDPILNEDESEYQRTQSEFIQQHSECCEFCNIDDTVIQAFLSLIEPPADKPKQQPPPSCKELRQAVEKKFDDFWKSQTGSDYKKWWEAFLKTVCKIESGPKNCQNCEGLRNPESTAIGCYQQLYSTLEDVWGAICNPNSSSGQISDQNIEGRYGVSPAHRDAFCSMIRKLLDKAKGAGCDETNPCGTISKEDQEWLIKLWFLRYNSQADRRKRGRKKGPPEEKIEVWLRRIYADYYKTDSDGYTDWNNVWPLIKPQIFPPPLPPPN